MRPAGYRGDGLFFTRSDLKLSNLGFSIDPETGEFNIKTPVPALRTDTFHLWLRTASEATDRAQRARQAAIAAPLESDEEFAAALEDEFRTSMLAITASAIAVDAFFASVVHHAPDSRREVNGNRAKTLIETFKQAFAIRGPNQEKLVEVMPQIFHLRRAAVHPPAEFSSPVRHPVYGLALEQRLVWFRAENATGAHGFTHALISFCLATPKPQWESLVTWCEQTRELVPPPVGDETP